MKKNVFLFITLISGYALAMEPEKRTHLLMIPGQKTLINQNVETFLPYFKKNQQLTHVIETPKHFFDFGQTRCQDCLTKKLDWLKKNDILHDNDPLIIHGSYDGTATAINYAAKNHQNVTCLILENVILSGNSFINDRSDKVVCPGISSIPKSCYLLPYATRIVYPAYSPAGEQPTKNVFNLPKDMLIIIFHNTEDPYQSCEDAEALFAFLRKTDKNKNVYFIPKTSEDIKIATINTLLKKHNIIPSNPNERCDIDLKTYQPEASIESLNHFFDVYNKDINFTYINSGIKYTAPIALCMLYVLYSYLGI